MITQAPAPTHFASDAVITAVAEDCHELNSKTIRDIFEILECREVEDQILFATIAVMLDRFHQKDFERTVPGFRLGGAIMLSAPKRTSKGRMRTEEMTRISDALEVLQRSRKRATNLRGHLHRFGLCFVFVPTLGAGIIQNWNISQFDQETAGWKIGALELCTMNELMERCLEYSEDQRFAIERTAKLADRIAKLAHSE